MRGEPRSAGEWGPVPLVCIGGKQPSSRTLPDPLQQHGAAARDLHFHRPRFVAPPTGKGRDGPSAEPALQSGDVVGEKNFFLLDYGIKWEYKGI